MTEEILQQYGKLAEAHKGRTSSKVVLDLIDYIDRLHDYIERSGGVRTPLPFGKSGTVSDEHACPIGKYKGEPLCLVPDEYLSWWASKNPRAGLQIDADFAAAPKNFIARQNLRLYDYAEARLKFKQRDDTQSSTQEDGQVSEAKEVGAAGSQEPSADDDQPF